MRLLAGAALSAPLWPTKATTTVRPTAPVTTLAPRAEAASADFELVAVLRDGTLTIHLDRFADNAPWKAAIEVDTPEGSQAAKPAGRRLCAAGSLR